MGIKVASDMNKFKNKHSQLAFFSWCSIAILLFVAYWPSLQGPFVFDDMQNIVKNPGVAIHDLSIASLKQALFSNDSGVLKRILPALSFGINHYMAGGFINTWIFKLTGLLIHVINMGLLMWFIFLLWPRFHFPHKNLSKGQVILSVAFIVALWALHPLNVSTVAYVVQRMTSMAAIFVLSGLSVFVYGRLQLEKNNTYGLFYMATGIIGGTALGLLNKENAALLSCYAMVIEFSLFKREELGVSQRWGLKGFYVLFVVIPICLALYYYFISPGNLVASYIGRPFSLEERLWTESRVLWFYLSLILIPDITQMGLFHDDIAVSHSWLQPISTLIAVVSWGCLLLAAYVLRHRWPVFMFAVLWYLVGHSLESSFLPLELVYEHRNYLPSIGVIILFVYCCAGGCRFVLVQGIKQQVILGLSGGLILGMLYTTWLRANYWKSEENIFTSLGQNHSKSPISQYLYAEMLFKTENKPVQAYPYYFKAAELNPDEVAFLVMALLTTPPEVMSAYQRRQKKTALSHAHIVDLVLHKPLSPWALTIFDAAGNCVLSRHKHCLAHISEVIDWLGAVLKSPYTDRRYKRKYRQQLYSLQMMKGHYPAALVTVKALITTYGRAFQYFLMQAEALQSLGKYDEALSILQEAERGVRGRRPDLLKKVKQMQRVILLRKNIK